VTHGAFRPDVPANRPTMRGVNVPEVRDHRKAPQPDGARSVLPRRDVLGLVACGLGAAALLGSCRTRRTGEKLVFPDPAAEGPLPPAEGYGLVGRAMADSIRVHPIGAPMPLGGDGAAKATLVRWWTDHCPFCASSLPAIEGLRTRYGPAGLATLGIYHPKPPRAVRDADVVAAALALGYRGSIAVDADWASLHRVWLDSGRRSATSVSLLLDRAGVVRLVNPGPELFPSTDAAHAEADRGYREMVRAIETLLAT